MNKQPLITIVTATYNIIEAGRKETFLQMLESVQNQDYPHIQHIIIDGASTDGTLELLKSQSLKSARGIEYISEPDQGIYDAMNKGIMRAKGKYIAFLNSDDYYHDTRALSLYAKALEENSADFASGQTYVLIEHGEEHNKIDYTDYSDVYKKIPFGHQSLFCKTQIMQAFPFDTKYKLAADYDFIFKLLVKPYKGIILPYTLVTFRGGGACYGKTTRREKKSIKKIYAPLKEQISKNTRHYRKSKPLLSFLTCIEDVNDIKSLEHNLKSVANQSYKDIEQLLFFNEEDKELKNQLEAFQKKYPFIRIIPQIKEEENYFNKAVFEAYGDYISFFSPQSYLSNNNTIEEVMTVFQELKRQAIYCNLTLYDILDKESLQQKIEKNFEKLYTRNDYLDKHLPYQAFIYQKRVLTKISLKQKQGQNRLQLDDFLLHNQLFNELGYAYAFIPHSLVHVQKNEINLYTEEEKESIAKHFIQYKDKTSAYDRQKVKKRYNIFRQITLLCKEESMWEVKYKLFDCLTVKTIKK